MNRIIQWTLLRIILRHRISSRLPSHNHGMQLPKIGSNGMSLPLVHCSRLSERLPYILSALSQLKIEDDTPPQASKQDFNVQFGDL
jgi:hypothetical protein